MTPIQHLIENFKQAGGKIKQCPPGNAVRDNDGEDWKTINENRYKIKLDKERADDNPRIHQSRV